MGDILTIRQVAELCAVVPSTVQHWERRGVLNSFKTFGGHRRFHREDVLAFLAQRGRKLTRRSSDDLLHKRFKSERRCETRLELQLSVEAEFTDGVTTDTRCEAHLTDVSNHGFGIVLQNPSTAQSLTTFIKKFHTLKAWIKDEVGFLKNPLVGTIRNVRHNSDQIKIGLALT
ncbi:MAG: helix-turn-helix domain-containing protein [Fibrobacterota bacterium]